MSNFKEELKDALKEILPPNWELIIPMLAILFIGFVLVSCGHSPSLDSGWLYQTVRQ